VSVPVPVGPEAAFVACPSCGGAASFRVFVRMDFGNGGCDSGGGGGVLDECRCGRGSGGVCAGGMEGDLFLSW